MPQPPDHGRAAQTARQIGAHSVELALASNGTAPFWIHLLPAGQFALRDGRGPYRVEDVAAVVVASRAGSLGGRLPIDRDHALDLMAPHGMPSPAAGWIEELEARADGVWGRVTRTERAALQIEALEYRYMSPVFNHDATGLVVRILRAALTNNPAIPTLKALASASAQQELDMDLALLRTALGAAIDADAGALVTAAADTRQALATVAAAVGLAADAKPADVVAKVAAALKAHDPARFVPLEVVDGLQTELATLRTSAASEKATAAVEAAIAAGKLMPCLRDWGLALATNNPAAFAAWDAATPVLASSQRLVGAPPPPAGMTKSPVEIAAAANALRAASAKDAIRGLGSEARSSGSAMNAGLAQGAGALERLRGLSSRVAESFKIPKNAIGQLAQQAQDVAQGLAAGQSPLVILAQQGGQIAQIFGPAGAIAASA